MKTIIVHHCSAIDVQARAIIRLGPERVATSAFKMDSACELGDPIVPECVVEALPKATCGVEIDFCYF
jgi:hypothetical protein